MKKPDFACIVIALFAFLHVYLLSVDDSGDLISRLGSPRREICWALAWLGGYFGVQAWIRPYNNDDVPAASIVAVLGFGSALLRPYL